MSQSPGSNESHSHHTHGYEMYRKRKASREEVDKPSNSPAKPPKSPAKLPSTSNVKAPANSPVKPRVSIPLDQQTSSLIDRILADSRSHYTSESYQCTDRDCELGSGCDGKHSYSNETLRIRFGIVPTGMPPADSDYWPHNWYRRQCGKKGLPRPYDNVDSDCSDSNDDDGGCSPSKLPMSQRKDSDNESHS